MCMCTTLQHSITMYQIPLDCIIWRKSCCLNTKNLSSGANLQAGVCTTSTSWFWLQCCTLIVFTVVCCFQEGGHCSEMFQRKRVHCLQSRVVHCSEMFLRGKRGSLFRKCLQARGVQLGTRHWHADCQTILHFSCLISDYDDDHNLLDTIVWNNCGAIIELVDPIWWHSSRNELI